MLIINAAFKEPVHRFDEVIAMELRMETDKVRAEHALEKAFTPWANAERFRIRPRDVPEDRHPRVRPCRFDQMRQQREMIILYQNMRFRHPVDLLQDRLGESLIDGLVIGPVLASENGAGV